MRQRSVERRERVGFGEMAQEAQDQLARDAERLARVAHRVAQAEDDRLHRDAARGMGLRIEEQLGVDDVVGSGAQQK